MKNMMQAVVIALVVAMGGAAAAQDAAPPQREQPSPRALVPLRLQLTLSRFQGEKKISSVPYVLWVTANQRGETSVRMGSQIPIASSSADKAFTYRDVGTNIDCVATTAPDGGYQITLTVTDSSVYYPDRNDPATAASANTGVPAFRNFTSRFNILMRDNQAAPYVSATDPVTGQVMRIEATLNVLK